jgi:aminoglycoside 6'-N-acetyltransferase
MGEPMLVGERVTLRLATEADIPALAAIRETPEVFAWWGAGAVADDLASPDDEVFAVLLAGRVVGAIQWYAEDEPDFRHAGIDVYLDPVVHGRGVGTDAVRTLARYLIHERGYHRLVIDPAADNVPAIRCYTKVGFRPVGVMRQYWRNPVGQWRDGLLMDLLVEDLPAAD